MRERTVGVTVERDKSLIAHLPQQVALDEATKLIARKLLWVHQKLAEQGERAREEVFRAAEFVDGEGFHFLGKHYRLKIVDVPKNLTGVPSVRLRGIGSCCGESKLPRETSGLQNITLELHIPT